MATENLNEKKLVE